MPPLASGTNIVTSRLHLLCSCKRVLCSRLKTHLFGRSFPDFPYTGLEQNNMKLNIKVSTSVSMSVYRRAYAACKQTSPESLSHSARPFLCKFRVAFLCHSGPLLCCMFLSLNWFLKQLVVLQFRRTFKSFQKRESEARLLRTRICRLRGCPWRLSDSPGLCNNSIQGDP